MTRLSPEAKALISRFENPQSFLAAFNPDKQIDYTLDKHRAYMGKAPSLGTVSQAYSSGTAKSWVMIQLWNLAEFCGCKTKMNEKQIEELAKIILKACGFMKVTEVMDFFLKIKEGEYGRFYGVIDPMVITTALKDFKKERISAIQRFEREDEESRRRADPNYIRYLRACLENERMLKFFSYNFRSLRMTHDEMADLWWLFNLGYERNNHGYVDP